MRRSLAPSVIKSNLKSDGGNNNETNNHNNSSRSLSSLPLNNENSNNDEMIIKQMPLFGFLSIPEGLAKQFTIPTGCLVTKESLELRKCRSLGAKRLFKRITPADLNSSLPRPTVMVPMLAEEGEEEEEMGVCTSAIPPHEPLVLWTDPQDETNTVEVIPELCHRLRPHQREGVQFLFECTMGLRGFEGQGCILADDMGLGKTFMSVTLLWTLMNQSFEKGVPAAKKVIVVCPTSLVGNWDNEIRKWVGEKCPTFPVKSDGKKMIQSFISHRGKGVLIVSYETQRRFCKMFEPSKQNSSSVCDLLICDEAHKLKNADSGLSKSLNLLPVRRRVLLSGTPMQNELTEFYNMVNFCNPGVIGTTADFRRQYERPILAARELGASDTEIAKAGILQKQLSTIVNEFILKRGNILNARHLPPKLVQFVCCRLSSVQTQIYEAVLNSKEARHIRDGKQLDTLATLRQLINVCSHPKLVLEGLKSGVDEATGVMKEDSKALFDLLNRLGVAKSRPPQQQRPGGGPSRITSSSSGTATSLGLHNSGSDWVDAELSGKLFVLCRMMQVMRAQKRGERIVIVSNYTQTLDLIESLCGQNQWPFLRLDGTTAGATRTKLVDRFNDPHSGQFAFLLSSKAGGCGINLIGGSRLVLFDPDWNPASDKQAAGRIWREGQQRRCFIYRFMSTNTVEEKIIQRQLSKEGLQNIVDDTDQVNTFSTEELKRLFVRREDDTRSDTHDTLRCKRCRNVFLTTTGCGASADKNKLVPSQIELCSQFIRDFYAFLTETVRVAEVEKSFEDLLSLCDDLQNGVFTTLPLFSRKLRSVLSGIEKELTEESLIRKLFSNGATLSSEFVDRWSDVVPTLTRLGKEYQKSLTASQRSLSDQGSNDDEDDEDASPDDEWVEQEGCPDESDFNKWSHHSSVQSCDDEVLKLAMSDDNTVSFVFGLEVNWSLLQVREEATREEVQRRKEQARADLEALNAKRRTEKAKESKTSLESDSKASYHESAPVKAGAKKGTKKDASKKSSAHADVAPITKKSAKNRRADLEDGRGNVVNLVNDKDESVSSDSDSDSGSSSDDSSAAVGDDDVGTEMDVEAPPMINKRAKSAESSASIKQTVAANTKRRLDQILDDSSNDESSIHLKSDKVSKLTSTVKKSKTFLDSDSDDDNQVELLSGTYSKSLQAKSVFSQKTLEDSSDDDFGLRRDAITEKPSVNSKSVDAKKRKKTALSDSDSDDTDQSVTKPLAKAKSSQAKSVAVNKGVVDLIDSPNDRTDKENVNRQHTGAATNTTVTVQKKKNIAVLIDLDDD